MKVIPLEQLQLNDGQVEWLPRNPRSFTQTDIDRTKASLDEDADFLQERPLLAIPGPDKTFVVFAGNLRLTAARELGWPGAPVVVYRPEGISKEDRDTIKRRALKDNGSFGSWDTDALANDWDADPWQLEQWGVPEWITGGAGKESGAPGSTGSGEGGDSPGEQKVKQPTLQALITFPDADALGDFADKYAPEIIEQYDAEIIY